MTQDFKEKLKIFHERAKTLLEKRKTSGQDAVIYSDLGEAFSLLSNGLYGLGLEHAKKVADALDDDELKSILKEMQDKE